MRVFMGINTNTYVLKTYNAYIYVYKNIYSRMYYLYGDGQHYWWLVTGQRNPRKSAGCDRLFLLNDGYTATYLLVRI